MTLSYRLAALLDSSVLRPIIASIATLLRWPASGGGQRFSVDRQGRWVNRCPTATIVSPLIHTVPAADHARLAADQWNWDYPLEAGDTVIDIGAGIGEDSVYFARAVGAGGRVIAIEAQPTTFACLEATIARSNLTNVCALQCAITDRDAPVTIDVSDNHVANSIIGTSGGITVPGRSLDSLAAELQLDRIDLVKMNIEGAEQFAVRGMGAIAKKVRHVVISCHDFISDGGGDDQLRTFAEVEQALDRLGFDTRSRPDHALPWVRYYLYGRNRALA